MLFINSHMLYLLFVNDNFRLYKYFKHKFNFPNNLADSCVLFRLYCREKKIDNVN